MTPAIRGVLFDMDGVLLHSYEAWLRVLQSAAVDLGYPPLTREQFHPLWGQGVQADVRNFFTRHTAVEIEAYYAAHFRDHAAQVSVHPEASRVIDSLRARGIRTAVITNTPTSMALEALSAAGLDPEVVVGASDVAREKPAPDMVILACERLGVPRNEAVVVGDSRYDREAAQAAGVRFAGLRIEGDVILQNLSEVLSWWDAPQD
jgi:phosphoglycolate phosphatase/AHBA synthesis associated protein